MKDSTKKELLKFVLIGSFTLLLKVQFGNREMWCGTAGFLMAWFIFYPELKKAEQIDSNNNPPTP